MKLKNQVTLVDIELIVLHSHGNSGAYRCCTWNVNFAPRIMKNKNIHSMWSCVKMNKYLVSNKINSQKTKICQSKLFAKSACILYRLWFRKTINGLAIVSTRTEQFYFLQVIFPAVLTRFRRFVFTILVVFLPGLGACDATTKARIATDFAIANVHKFDVETLVQVETSRQRLRKARCYNPMLTPAAISSAAEDPRLGENWIDELLKDCPQFSAFILELALRRVQTAGFFKSESTK